MPEFQLDYGSRKAMIEFDRLDAFTRGYVEAVFFTDTGYPENEELETATFDELSADTRAWIESECARFQENNAANLEAACDFAGYDMENAGRDFWYTRNGHGVGFWDRGLGAVGDSLSDAARKAGEC